jgi:hypothetical protein
MARLIDTYARTFDVSDTRVVLVDASPEAVLAAGERLEIVRTVGQAIEALGLADRLALAPTLLESRDGEHVYGMPAASVKVIWDVRVEPGPDSGTTLSMTARFVSTDHSSRERLRAAWPIVGPVSAALSKRALAEVTRHAEDHDELASPDAEASTLALAA